MPEELRAPRRAIRRPARDESGELFKTILVVFAGMVVVILLWSHAQATNKSKLVEGATALPPQHNVAPAPQQVAPVASARTRLAQPPAGPSAADVDRYRSLQAYCYRMSRMNADGDYPAFQQAACGDFQRFAQQKGWDTGGLPEVRFKQAAVVPTYRQPEARSDEPSAECASLERAKQGINARMRQLYNNWEGERFREQLREIGARMWDLNCRNH